MSEPQSAAAVVMIRPDVFFTDPGTAATNHFQSVGRPDDDVASLARREFDGVTAALARAGIEIIVARPPAGHELPDAIFPNNWFSTHADGTVVLYPMHARLRRLERQSALIDALRDVHGFDVRRVVDLSPLEASGEFVEGTGSLVFDRSERIAYAARSPRTTERAVKAACEALEYFPCLFSATDRDGAAIYHTNVMLSIGGTVVVGCFDSVRDDDERRSLLAHLECRGRAIVPVTLAQTHEFGANVLELQGRAGPVLALSTRAWSALDPGQRRCLEGRLSICPVAVDMIEQVGGGGIRCMLAEVHLPRRPTGSKREA